MKCEVLRQWDSVLADAFGERTDVYMGEGYHGLYRSKSAAPVCLRAYNESDTYLLPGILHGPAAGHDDLYFETAYGYGGPISTSSDEGFVSTASKAVLLQFQEMGVARARLRFHPVLQNERLAGPGWRVTYSRDTAGIALAGTPDDILNAMHPKHRNMVRRAGREGLEFVWDEDLARLPEFVALYNDTMDRLRADTAYYYSNEYYDLLTSGLDGRVALGVVMHEGVPVSAAIFFKQGAYSHYHLSGSSSDAPPGAGQLLLYGAAVALQESGAELLHLGGGTTPDTDDSLLKFKQRFGSLRFKYHVGVWRAGGASE